MDPNGGFRYRIKKGQLRTLKYAPAPFLAERLSLHPSSRSLIGVVTFAPKCFLYSILLSERKWAAERIALTNEVSKGDANEPMNAPIGREGNIRFRARQGSPEDRPLSDSTGSRQQRGTMPRRERKWAAERIALTNGRE